MNTGEGRRVVGWMLALAVLSILPYLPALSHEFVYDDGGSIAENAFLNEPGAWSRVLTLRVFTEPSVPDGRRPMVILSYLLDRAVWGLRPFGFHLTNLLLHAGNVLLLFLLAGRLTGGAPGSFLPLAAALLFGLHPVASEAVLVPAFREDLLLTLFLLGFLLGATKGSWWALPLLVGAMLSKEAGVVGPALLAWVLVCNRAARPPGGVRGLMVMSCLLALLFTVILVFANGLQAVSFRADGIGLAFPANLFTLPALWLKALRLLILPWPLLADHVIEPVTAWRSASFLAGLAALAAWMAAAWTLRRRQPILAVGLGWILLSFLPVSNLVPLFNPFAERYLYLPAAGAVLAAAALLARLPPAPRRALPAVLALAGAALISLRRPDWATDTTVWYKTLRQEPRSARAHTWTGLALKRRGDLDGARARFLEADRLNSALINLAVLEGQQGRLEEAVARLEEAIRRRPDKAEAWWNLATALHALGREEEAGRALNEALARDPRHPARPR